MRSGGARRHGTRFVVHAAPTPVTSARKFRTRPLNRLMLTMVGLAAFPPALRFRGLCGLWYDQRLVGNGRRRK